MKNLANEIGLHLTIGNPNELNKSHSEYIYRSCLLLDI